MCLVGEVLVVEVIEVVEAVEEAEVLDAVEGVETIGAMGAVEIVEAAGTKFTHLLLSLDPNLVDICVTYLYTLRFYSYRLYIILKSHCIRLALKPFASG